MSAPNTSRGTISGCFRNGRLWLIQFLANPAIFGLFAVWLLIPVARTWQVVLNALFVLVLIAAAVALHGGTLNYFYEEHRGEKIPLKNAFLRALGNIFPILICAAVFYGLWLIVDWAGSYQDTVPTYLRSEFPAFLRRHITLSFLMTSFDVIIFILRWIVVPGLVLPFALNASNRGFRGFGPRGFSTWRKSIFSRAYWFVLALAAVVGIYITNELVGWTPDFRTSTYRHEILSMVVRLLISYCLALTAWMLACSAVGRRSALSGQGSGDVSRNPAG